MYLILIFLMLLINVIYYGVITLKHLQDQALVQNECDVIVISLLLLIT